MAREKASFIKEDRWQVLKVIYTTEFLLNNAGVVTELCIKSKVEKVPTTFCL